MAQENLKENTTSSSGKSANLKKSVDLNKLAEKIIALLLKEISIESERLGR